MQKLILSSDEQTSHINHQSIVLMVIAAIVIGLIAIYHFGGLMKFMAALGILAACALAFSFIYMLFFVGIAVSGFLLTANSVHLAGAAIIFCVVVAIAYVTRKNST